ncbi:hypothetical protein [Rhizobium sullae]|uniref:hypothetical protein n=1 Tax=Rhizobium sullae TaxID=50338 RepID=UPI000B35BFB7|nr:hypothetical protein [Rhizobium sullae]
MAIKLLNSCLDILHPQGLASQVLHSYFASVKRDLLDDDTVVAALVVAAGQLDVRSMRGEGRSRSNNLRKIFRIVQPEP